MCEDELCRARGEFVTNGTSGDGIFNISIDNFENAVLMWGSIRESGCLKDFLFDLIAIAVWIVFIPGQLMGFFLNYSILLPVHCWVHSYAEKMLVILG